MTEQRQHGRVINTLDDRLYRWSNLELFEVILLKEERVKLNSLNKIIKLNPKQISNSNEILENNAININTIQY